MREVVGGKKNVTWILKHGSWTQAAVDLMNEDTAEVTQNNLEARAAWEANRGLAASQTTFPRPKRSAKDPYPDARVRNAAKQRRDMHVAANHRTKNWASAAGDGVCAD